MPRRTTATDAAARSADIERVLDVFNGFMQRVMATHVPEFNAVELTMSQAKALYVVMAAGQLRMSELASRLGITSSTATGVVDGLVALGLLVRQEDAHDRRQVVVAPTSEAEGTLERLRELNSRTLRELLRHVGPADLAIVEQALHVMDAAIRADPTTDTTNDRSTRSDPTQTKGDHS